MQQQPCRRVQPVILLGVVLVVVFGLGAATTFVLLSHSYEAHADPEVAQTITEVHLDVCDSGAAIHPSVYDGVRTLLEDMDVRVSHVGSDTTDRGPQLVLTLVNLPVAKVDPLVRDLDQQLGNLCF